MARKRPSAAATQLTEQAVGLADFAAKTQDAIDRASDPFRISELQQACPGVSVDLIRRVLKDLRAEKKVECLGRGQQAQWRKTRGWRIG